MFNRKLQLLLVALFLPLTGLLTLLPPAEAREKSPSYLFCFWNVENLFDDQIAEKSGRADKPYDTWFANDADTRNLKYANLSKALLQMNNGKGPDILGVVEVETVRAAELLRSALNERLSDKSLHYKHVLMKEVRLGRHIAPAIITRLPVRGDKTRLHGKKGMRILEGHIVVNRKELIVLVTHWTSHIKGKGGDHRDGYGDQIYGAFKAMYKSNPRVDLLVCGDFNTNPKNDSVTQHLHATDDRRAVLNSGKEPLLFNLFGGKDPAEGGTLYDRGHWLLYDQIAVSPGLLDQSGWSCDPSSATIENRFTAIKTGTKKGRPWRFGNRKDKGKRGYSDHFPVTVRLRVNSR